MPSPNGKRKNSVCKTLREAMVAAGFEPKPAVLGREFNTRYWGKPMTLHGVRRWPRCETSPVCRARWDSGIGYQDRDIFEAFLKLPVPQRKLIGEVILAFAKVHSVTELKASSKAG